MCLTGTQAVLDHTVDVELVSEQKLACTVKIMLGKHSLHAVRSQFWVKTLRKIQKNEVKKCNFFHFFRKVENQKGLKIFKIFSPLGRK